MRRMGGPPSAWADLSCTPAELCDLLAALLEGNDGALADELIAGERPLAAFAMLVERHRLGCFLSGRLEGSPIRAVFPDDLLHTIEKRRQQQHQRTHAILAELRWLLPHFEAAGIAVMLLKGPELAARFHGGLHARGYGDLDLLVRGSDRRAALELLDALGYELRSRVVLSRTLMAQVHHGFDFERGGVRLDLHWCLSRLPGFRIDEAGFWDRSQLWIHDGLAVNVPAPADELHLLLIGAFADLQRGALRLQSLLDVRALQAALPADDPDAFLDARQAEGTSEVCRSMLRLDQALLGNQNGNENRNENAVNDPVPAAERTIYLGLLASTPLQFSTKFWCARHLPVSLPGYILWWLASLPLRTAASHPSLRRPRQNRPAASGEGR